MLDFLPMVIGLVFVGVCLMLMRQNKTIKLLADKVERLEMQASANEMILSDLQIENKTLASVVQKIESEFELKATEDIQVSKQIEHRIKVMQTELSTINERINQLAEQQPQDKLYSRASKLAALGADVEEIMRECELPQAEVEMLLSVYKK